MKHAELNRAIIKHCVNFHIICWEAKNKKLHDPAEQRMRVTHWCKREREEAVK